MEEGKQKSSREESEKKEESRKGDRNRDREKERDDERPRERGKGRDRDRERRSEREKSTDDKHREKHRDRGGESRKEKEKDRDRAKEKVKEREVGDKERDREERHKEREKEKEREREERDKLKEKERGDKERDKLKERERGDKERNREERHKEKERKKEKERDKEERDKEREREKEREVEEREKEREREKKRARDREEREREREREARKREERERERAREREERERDKERERERERAREKRDRDHDEDSREHDRKRRRREDSHERSSRSERHEEGGEERRRKRSEEASEDNREKNHKTQEVDLEEEQRKLDEEMDRRRRRVQEWQELKRKQEEQERENGGVPNGEEQPKSGKKWTLEGESDDDEAGPDQDMAVDEENSTVNTADDHTMDVDSVNENGQASMVEGADGEDEVDPLDAFMNSILPEVENIVVSDVMMTEPGMDDRKEGPSNGRRVKGAKNSIGRILQDEDSEIEDSDLENDEVNPEDEDDDAFMKRVKKTKVDKLSLVDHSKIQYPPFRKNFYIEVKEISRMTLEEVAAYRKEHELKIHGKDVPKPVKTWNQTGLPNKILDTIKKLSFETPMSIQAQSLPIIMSGRDCIGIAKTGSGKTLAFVLPMLRHIKDQPPVVTGDGPIGLIMAPTRELVQQIHSDIKKFSKSVGVTCVPVYGGSGVAQQISDLKRGAEIVVCTPGRMIDILCTSSGKITNLRRVTYLVMDEADRMFDMGFEPQITRIVQNTRPDRQTVLFSATFPRQVEILARKVLNKPVEIQVGGRSVVNKDIAQLIEVRQESERFLRLLELLGEWYEKGKILIFVQSQDKCDSLFKDLLKHGYPCLSLHGAKDQNDRESTIADFKSGVCNLLIATSIAARGLDVKELELVVNFDAPNHYEDYVHRVGRTGRAGRKGCAVTFISEDDARYAPDLVKALKLSEQAVPEDLKALADGFMSKVNQGMEHVHGTGYGGSGFKFNEEESEARNAAKKAQAKGYGFEEDKSDSDSDDEGVRKAGGDIGQSSTPLNMTLPSVSLPGVAVLPGNVTLPLTSLPTDAAARAAAIAAAMNLQHNLAKLQHDAMPEHYEAEFEINDFPQNARWKITHKETLGPISEWTGAAITTRGQFYPSGKIPGPGERKLYLFIEGPTESSVKKAKAEVKRVLEDYTAQAFSLPGSSVTGKYSL